MLAVCRDALLALTASLSTFGTQASMKVDIKTHKKMLYMGGNLLYLAGWAITLIGLALVQDECKDIVEDGVGLGRLAFGSIPFFTTPVGEDCKKGFRFFWFMWVLNSIPPLLAVVATFMPDLARGVSTSYFAVIAPLNILMANSFFDAIELTNNDMEKNMKVSMAGFCILAGAALLMLLMDSLLVGDSGKGTVQHADAAAKPAEAV
eukprot:jgi/Ulvmu1/3248/UM150_0021.1